MQSFSLQIAAYAEKQKGNFNDVVRTVVLDVARRVVNESPVGDPSIWQNDTPPPGYVGGRFKGSWDAEIGGAPTALLRTIDPTGDASMQRIEAALAGDVAGTVVFIANNSPYAMRLEDGWSSQAPEGMVGLVQSDWQMIMADAVAKANAGGS